MLVELIAHTNDPERTIAAAAKLCYSDAHIDTLLEGLTPEKTAAFLQKLSDVGHASPIEHASFTFGIEGVSRTLPGAGHPPPHRPLSACRASAMSRLEAFPLCHPAGDRGYPRSQGPVHRWSMEDDRRTTKYLELVHTLEEMHTPPSSWPRAWMKRAARRQGRQAGQRGRPLCAAQRLRRPRWS